jgi:hypothetical protein
MLKTTSFISSINEVPRAWVFEHYLQLSQKLTGQDVKLSSPLTPQDKNPSFFVYYNRTKKKYLFKDFSTDKQGDGTMLVMELHNLTTRGEAAHKIIEDYNQYALNNKDDYSNRLFQLQEKYKVSGFTLRKWTNFDVQYWTKYSIGSDLLNFYNVKPLESYTLSKTEDSVTKELTMSNNRIYGYFKKDGSLYKIYQPIIKSNKFLKVTPYIQGTDQLTFNVPYLVICSSLKDGMAFRKMNLKNAEWVAPDSENTLIPKQVIKLYQEKYENVCTLFDNDTAGIKAMEKYYDTYGIKGVRLNLEKDFARCIKNHGVENTRIQVYPLLTEILTGKSKHI